MRALAAAVLLALAGCAGGPVPPDWEANAHAALRGYTSAYLKGNTLVAAQDFARARTEIASTGRPGLLARAELLRCAVRVASLEFDACPGYAALAADAGAAERAYAAFLSGNWQGLDAALLPEQHRAVITRAADHNTLTEIKEPLSRLVAAGALLRAGRLPPEAIAQATEAASGQGWRRPLLAWLDVMLKRAEAIADADAAGRIRRRIGLVTQGGSTR